MLVPPSSCGASKPHGVKQEESTVVQDPFDDDEPVGEPEPKPWRPPVRCPACHGNQTRLATMHYEMSVYECDECGAQFEIEEEA